MPSFCTCPHIKIAGRSIGDLAPYACPCVKKGEAAAAEYKKRGAGADPLVMYDVNVAKRLLADEG